MKEIWRNIEEFEGYQVSDRGQVGSFWKKKHKTKGYGTCWVLCDERRIMRQSDDGNGYMKVCLTDHSTGKKYCRKVHKLVADAFLGPHEAGDTVDHIKSGPEGKLDNSVRNLQWLSRPENIKKAYRDGMCDARITRQNKAIFAIDLWTGKEAYFSSINEASSMLGIDRSSISHVLRGDHSRTSHYRFEYADDEGRLLYDNEDNKISTWIQFGIY